MSASIQERTPSADFQGANGTQTSPKELNLWQSLASNGAILWGGGTLAILGLLAALAPWLYTIDPTAMDPAAANLLPWTQAEFMSLAGDSFPHFFIMGTDALGRDLWSRVAFGARVSIIVGVAAALLSLFAGMMIGVCAGYFRRLDGAIMRVMDGMMAIPNVLFAITLVAVWRPTLTIVVIAITIPEIPRVARLVRSVVLTVRGEAFVEAAIALDTPTIKIVLRHILPSAIAPVIVQGTYICASAMITEAVLSFLGVGLPPSLPTWGNIMAEGRTQFMQYPYGVLLPGLLLGVAVLAVNVLGDGLRDTLDPKFRKRTG
ncbi:ABC transporter permease [Cupriavidus basilensis]